MDHISKNKRKIGEKTYWVTDNPNIVIELTTHSEEIHLDILDRQISEYEEKTKQKEFAPITDEDDKEKLNFFRSLKGKVSGDNLQ